VEHWLTVALTVLLVLLDLAIRVFAIIYVPINRKPQTATGWLLAIFLIPYIGFIVFLVIGSTKLPKARREKQTEINAYILEQTEGIERVRRDHPWPPWFESITELNRKLGAMPLVGGNSAELYPDSEEAIHEMARAIDAARRFVHVEFYIATLDATTRPFFAALSRAQARGVRVRFLMDHWASRGYPGFKDTLAFLDRAGIEWHLMLPLQPLQGKFQRPDLRNHRKIMVIDGSVAFTGSQNLIDKSYDLKGNIARGLAYKDLFARGAGGRRDQRPVRHRLVQRDRRAPAPRERPRPPCRPRRRARLSGRPVGAGLRRREQPAPVQRAAVLGAEAGVDHLAVLRPRRLDALRDHDDGAARGGGRALRG
jgi:cardiolipin synthase